MSLKKLKSYPDLKDILFQTANMHEERLLGTRNDLEIIQDARMSPIIKSVHKVENSPLVPYAYTDTSFEDDTFAPPDPMREKTTRATGHYIYDLKGYGKIEVIKIIDYENYPHYLLKNDTERRKVLHIATDILTKKGLLGPLDKRLSDQPRHLKYAYIVMRDYAEDKPRNSMYENVIPNMNMKAEQEFEKELRKKLENGIAWKITAINEKESNVIQRGRMINYGSDTSYHAPLDSLARNIIEAIDPTRKEMKLELFINTKDGWVLVN